MKLRIIDRILIALTGLILLALGAWIVLDVTGVVMPVSEALAWLLNVQSLQMGLGVAALCLALALLGAFDVGVLFRRRKGKHGFIAQKAENGEIAISVQSIETLVFKCAQKHGEIQLQSVDVDEARGGLIIKLRASLASGMNIPLAVGTLQKQIKQYVAACSGVDVYEVRVRVDSTDQATDDSPYEVPEAPAALPVEQPETEPIPAEAAMPVELPEDIPEAVAEPEERPLHQRMFSAVEEPNIVPEPPVQDVPDEEAIRQEAEDAAAEAIASIEEAEAQWDAVAEQVEETEAQWDAVTEQVEETEAQWDAVAEQVEETEAQWDAVAEQAEETQPETEAVADEPVETPETNWEDEEKAETEE